MRGEVWLAEVGRKKRPVVVLTRSEVLDVRALVTVAEVTTSIRGLASEVTLDHVEPAFEDCAACAGKTTACRRLRVLRAPAEVTGT